jgi:lysophospholipase L1-like esterase
MISFLPIAFSVFCSFVHADGASAPINQDIWEKANDIGRWSSQAPTEETTVHWIDAAQHQNLVIEGLPWFSILGKYRRLPLDPDGKEFSTAANFQAENTAGAQIRFRTNSPFVHVRVRLQGRSLMDNMPASGQSGVDAYDDITGRLRFCGLARVQPGELSYEAEACSWGNYAWKGVTLNLPLFNGIDKLEIGIAPESGVEKPWPHRRPGKLVIYGSSITQGGVASRPGLAWSNQLSRTLDQEIVNLGFAASGLGEAVLAKYIGEIQGISLILLDYEANAQTSVGTTLEPFIQILRQRYPAVPIVVMSQIPWVLEIQSRDYSIHKSELRDFQRHTVFKLRAEGDANLHFIDGYELMPHDRFEEGLLDGVHPNDLGMTWIAEGVARQLTELGLGN